MIDPLDKVNLIRSVMINLGKPECHPQEERKGEEVEEEDKAHVELMTKITELLGKYLSQKFELKAIQERASLQIKETEEEYKKML